jgi:hypothetical protein
MSKPERKKILLAAYGGAHVNMIIPVAKRLAAEGFETVILGLTTAPATLAKHGLQCKTFRDYIGLFPDQDAIPALGRKLKDTLTSNPQISEDETVAYLGLSYWDLEQTHGEATAARMYADKGRQIFKPVRVLKKILQAEQPDLVAATCSPRSEEAALLAARELGIPSVLIVNMYMEGLFNERDFAKDFYADHVFLPSEIGREKLIAMGRSPKALTVSGNPAFEAHFSPTYIEQARRYRRDHFGVQRTVVAFAKAPSHTTFGAMDVRIETALKNLVERNPACGLIIRDHPNERLKPPEGVNGRVAVMNEGSLSVLLNVCDILVTQVSTVGIEAHLMGKQLLYFSDQSTSHFKDSGSGVAAESISELIEKVECFRPAPPTDLLLPPSSEIIVEKIKKILD